MAKKSNIKQVDCTELENSIRQPELKTFEQIEAFAKEVAAYHNIKFYTIEIHIWQDGTRQLMLTSHIETYKIVIQLEGPFKF